jgi:hypothetical protein
MKNVEDGNKEMEDGEEMEIDERCFDFSTCLLKSEPSSGEH